MKRLYLIILFAIFFARVSYSQTCSGFNSTTTGPAITPDNTNEHQDGLHSWSKSPIYGCKYTHANSVNKNCNTLCTVAFTAGFVSIEKGTITDKTGQHWVSGSTNPGQSNGVNAAASCRGYLAAAASNCLSIAGACIPTLTIVPPATVKIDTSGRTVWNSGVIGVDNTCAAAEDPENNTDPNGPPTPPPCSPPPSDQQFTISDGERPDCEPLILDLKGNGFHLTDTAHGVVFDIRADHRPLLIPWTANSNNAFLVLDRNGNGVIDDGAELFSNVSPQTVSTHPNGFRALAEYDKPENGGDGDGEIDDQDAIFSQLRLWVDANHDGISQPEELHTLPELGVYSVSLDVLPSHRKDQFGNEFLYKARVNQGHHYHGSEVGRIAYDVFFVTR